MSPFLHSFLRYWFFSLFLRVLLLSKYNFNQNKLQAIFETELHCHLSQRWCWKVSVHGKTAKGCKAGRTTWKPSRFWGKGEVLSLCLSSFTIWWISPAPPSVEIWEVGEENTISASGWWTYWWVPYLLLFLFPSNHKTLEKSSKSLTVMMNCWHWSLQTCPQGCAKTSLMPSMQSTDRAWLQLTHRRQAKSILSTPCISPISTGFPRE